MYNMYRDRWTDDGKCDKEISETKICSGHGIKKFDFSWEMKTNLEAIHPAI